MKRYILFTLLFLTAISTWAQNDSTSTPQADTAVDALTGITDLLSKSGDDASLWKAANQAYMDGQYPVAVSAYETLLNKGLHSAKLYYNLANAYFQQNQLGKAVLNYTRAAKLDPSDEDITYNLQLAKARTKDKIEPVPQFFMKDWLVAFGGIMNSHAWAVTAIFLAVMAFASVLLWLVSGKLGLRKLGFFTALICAVLFVCSVAYSQIAASEQYDERGAIVMNSAAPIKSSPSAGGKDLFMLHEGTYVKVIQHLDGWSEVLLDDGNKGWITDTAIEQLYPKNGALS